MTTSFRDEIKECLDHFYGELEGVHVPPIMEEEHNKYTDEILKLIQERIDSIDTNPNSYYEWHCQNARDSLIEEFKEELLK